MPGRQDVRFVHAAAEDMACLGDASVDVVSACLVFHELPQHAARAILKEAHRVLRPGGHFAMMDMDPQAPAFRRIANNAFAYTAFKSTEPWLEEYATIDLSSSMRDAGFETPAQRSNSPRHRTLVAKKPVAP